MPESMMNRIVEGVLIDKQFPYDKLSEKKGKANYSIYHLNDNGIKITVGPYIYPVYKPQGRSKLVRDGIVVKIYSEEPPLSTLRKSITNKIDEKVKPLNLT